MKKLTLFALALAISVSTYLYAADNVGQSSGVSRTLSPSRWQVAKTGAELNVNSTTGTTNVVTAASALIGKIVFVPGAVTDVIKIYSATTGAGASVSTLIFEATANSPTLGNSPTTSVGVPLIYDLTPGWSATNGITVISTRVNTSSGSKAYIGWDFAQ